jgi:hypothetical protein
MKSFFKILQVLFILNLFGAEFVFSQEKKILLLPLPKNMIELDRGTREMFKYNKMNLDSVNIKISELVTERFIRNFNEYKIENIYDKPELKYLNDSLVFFQKWNSFRVQEFENSGKLGKMVISNVPNENKDYIGRYIAQKFEDSIKNIVLKNNYINFVLINKLEVKNQLNSNKKIIIHFEFYDKNAKRVYGGKHSTTISITKRTYGNVFFYFLKNCLDSHFQNTKQNYFQ